MRTDGTKKKARAQFYCRSALTSGALIPILFLTASLATTSFALKPTDTGTPLSSKDIPDTNPFGNRPLPFRIETGVNGPKSIAISPDGKFYLSHYSPHNQSIEDRWGAVSEILIDGDRIARSSLIFAMTAGVDDLTVDPFGNLYMTDPEHHVILKFDPKDPQRRTNLFFQGAYGLVGLNYDRIKDQLYYSTTIGPGMLVPQNSIKTLNRDGTQGNIFFTQDLSGPILQHPPLSFVLDSQLNDQPGIYYASRGGLKFIDQSGAQPLREETINSEPTSSVVITSERNFIIYSTFSGKIIARSLKYNEEFLLKTFREPFESPTALALDENDDLYVVHANANFITKITLSGDNLFAHCHGGYREGEMLKDMQNGGWYCRFRAGACPTDFGQYRNWSATSNVTCYGGSTTGCKDGRKNSETGNHDWADLAQEKAFAPEVVACGPANSGHNNSCSAKFTQIGCKYFADADLKDDFFFNYDKACIDAGGNGLRFGQAGTNGMVKFCKFTKVAESLEKSNDGYIIGCPRGWHQFRSWSKVIGGQWWGEVKNIFGEAFDENNCNNIKGGIGLINNYYLESIPGTRIPDSRYEGETLANTLQSWRGDRTKFVAQYIGREWPWITFNGDVPGEYFKYCSIKGHGFRDQSTPHSCSHSDLIRKTTLYCERSKHTHYGMIEIGCEKDR